MKVSKGHLQAFGAYLAWGVFPAYWKWLQHISSLEILFHRIIWGFFFFLALVVVNGKLNLPVLLKTLRLHFFSVFAMALLIGTNWFIYIYAVQTNRILEGSLAYFITPLINILIGAWFFNEKLSIGMKIAGALAGVAVVSMAIQSHQFPWISVSLAFSFVSYGIFKKKSKVGGLESSFLENVLLLTPALVAAIVYRNHQPDTLVISDYLLLMGGGAITGIPILLFSLSMKTVPLNHVGVLQFIGPSLQFLIGYFIFNESVSHVKMTAFILVWIAVIIYIRELVASVNRNG